MKINFVLVSLKTGGGNRVVFELCNSLVNLGHQVEIICANNSDAGNTFKLDGRVEIIKIGSYSASKVKKIFNIINTLLFAREKRAGEIVILSDPIQSLFTFLLGRCKVYRFLQADDYCIFDDKYLLKTNILLSIYKLLTKISYKSKIKYIFNSRYTYEKFIKVSRREDVKYRLIHPAVNSKYFYNKQIRDFDGLINIAIVARVHPGKGFINFVEALEILYHNASEFRSKIGKIYVISHDDLSAFNLSDVEIVVPSGDEEIADCLNQSHIFISTSWWEGFGLPPLEAMFCGCAVILTNSGGVNEYAIQNHNCVMIEAKNSELLQERLVALIDDKFLMNKLSTNASRLTNNFSWDISAKQLLDILTHE